MQRKEFWFYVSVFRCILISNTPFRNKSFSHVRKSENESKMYLIVHNNLGSDDEKELYSNRPTLFVLNVNISCTNFVTIKPLQKYKFCKYTGQAKNLRMKNMWNTALRWGKYQVES